MKVIATYQIPASRCPDPDKRGRGIALGMTIGSWSGISSAQQDRQSRYAGVYLGSENVFLNSEEKVQLRIGFPISNFPVRLSEILVAVFGKLSMDGEIKLVDLFFPSEMAKEFPGPKFGIEGVRKHLRQFHRPLLMSIFKSGFDLSPEEYAEAFGEQVSGGVDIVKDDEINFDEKDRLERVKHCRKVIDDISRNENRQVLYAVNLSAPPSKLIETACHLVDEGANALLVNVLAYGWNVMQELAEHSKINVILLAHPALAGCFYPSSRHGISAPLLLGSLMRMSGADLALFPSPYGNVSLPKDDALEIAGRLSEKSMFKSSFPVPSAGIHPGMIPQMMIDFGKDVVVNAGGGIHHHPSGTRNGAKAFLDAINGLSEGIEINRIAEKSPALKEALSIWKSC
ncbi:MAG: 2,3-diketo-5-methylthiopentyl-1-phosphate enolase [Nitrospirae bacterium]|nr:2,3-diketo-5-methylthiopentyl-1-phosphate enolase [Nitrospirota bacterium]